jgi:sugar lactone lactonase YvrE
MKIISSITSLIIFVSLVLASCGGGGGGASSGGEVITYTISGSSTGQTGSMMLQNNGADNLAVATNGIFTFPTAISSGSSFNVSVLTNPSGQSCRVSNGTGVITQNTSNVTVACNTLIQMGGVVQGPPLSLTTSVTTFAGATYAGSSDNTIGTLASFTAPSGIATDGNNLYVADKGNNKIRKIAIATGAVTTLAGSGSVGSADNTIGTLASFSSPNGITTDGTNLYVADTGNNKIRKIVIASGAVTTFAGSGTAGFSNNTTGTLALFNNPMGITTDGTSLYVTDTSNFRIRMIVIATGAVTTFAGTGTQSSTDNTVGTLASFMYPRGITANGTNLFVTDLNTVRQIAIATGAVSTIAGSGSSGSSDNTIGTLATFFNPVGITTDGNNLYVADTQNYNIRKIAIATGAVTTLAGSGSVGSADNTNGTLASFHLPSGIATDGTNLYVADTENNMMRKIQ